VTAVVSEPEFRTSKTLDERWVELWETMLGVHGVVVDPIDDSPGCSSVADLWTGKNGSDSRAEVIVGKSRSDEMALVALRIEQLLASGAENIAVVFPKADVAHILLAQDLTRRGVLFADLLESSGSPSIDLQLLRGILQFYSRGCRLEDLLSLWPLLRSLNLATQPTAIVRRICEQLFDEFQVHSLEACVAKLQAGEKPEWKEVARVVGLLLPSWPTEFTFAYGLERFASACAALGLEIPGEWTPLAHFAEKQKESFPAAIVFGSLESFLPERVPTAKPVGKGVFARVTFTTRRRAAGSAWSHIVFVESNAGVWPVRLESSGWLSDEHRRSIDASAPYSLGVMTSDDRAEIEKQGYIQLAGDAKSGLIFSAALGEDDDPETPLSPNSWLERILLSRGMRLEAGGIERVFSRLATSLEKPLITDVGLTSWEAVWFSRRDPLQPFDRFFFSDPTASSRPQKLAARLIEQGVSDPAVLWFNAVLGVQRTEWRPLARSYSRSLGQFAHRLLAEALQGPPAEDFFQELPKLSDAGAKLETALEALRVSSPSNRYWQAFLGELSGLTTSLLNQVYTLNAGTFVHAEASLPRSATIPLGGDSTVGVSGRMDLVLLDRPRWKGARATIIDFKTGADAKMSARRMGSSGASLQLGIYLAAAQSLGIAEGAVWMLKPSAIPESVATDELKQALAPLARIETHLRTGIYGALTKDRTEFTRGFEWPLACAPIKNQILREKFEKTFGPGGQVGLEEDLYE
jgi:hypothetical protein